MVPDRHHESSGPFRHPEEVNVTMPRRDIRSERNRNICGLTILESSLFRLPGCPVRDDLTQGSEVAMAINDRNEGEARSQAKLGRTGGRDRPPDRRERAQTGRSSAFDAKANLQDAPPKPINGVPGLHDLLESQGLICAAPRSGYFVNPSPAALRLWNLVMSTPREGAHPVEIADLVYEILSSVKSRRIVPFGSAFPSPLLFPRDTLRRALSSSTRSLGIWSTFDDLPPGNERLRRQIVRRYLSQGVVGRRRRNCADEWCSGGTEFMPAALPVAQPGDAVVVESSLVLRRTSVARAASAQGHRSADAPARRRGPLQTGAHSGDPTAKSLLVDDKFPEPAFGCSLSREKKQALVDLLSHNVRCFH